METNGTSLFDQQQPPKKDRTTAFVLGTIAALGVAGALGLGFVIGGRGGDTRGNNVDGVTVSPTQRVPVSPTARPTRGAAQSGSSAADTGSASDADGAGTGDSSVGAGSDSGAPAATNTTEPAPTRTPEPPTSTATATPEDPTSTPTTTPTATATAGPCAWCPDFDLIDPGVLIFDFVAPTIGSVSYNACVSNLHVYFETDEDADLWVVYSVDGGFAHVTGMENGQVFENDIALGAAFVTVTFQLHAKDDNGNERISAAYETFAGICIPPDFIPDLDLGF